MTSRYWTRRFTPATDGRPNNHPLPFNDHIVIPKGTDRNNPNATCYKVEVITQAIREIHHFVVPYTMKQITTILRSGKDVPSYKVQCYLSLLTARLSPANFVGHAADYICFMVLRMARDAYADARKELIDAERDFAAKKNVTSLDTGFLMQVRENHDFWLERLAIVRLLVKSINVEIGFARVRAVMAQIAKKRQRAEFAQRMSGTV